MSKRKKSNDDEVPVLELPKPQQNGNANFVRAITMTLTNIKLSKAKIKDSMLHIEFEAYKSDGSFDTLKGDFSNLVHADLRKAFSALVPHMIILTDMRELKFNAGMNQPYGPDVYEVEELEHIKVTGFTISGNGDNEGVVLTGSKQIGTKSININTPLTKWTDDVEPYVWSNELAEAIELCKHEVNEYILGKQAEKAQQQIDFGDEEENDN